MLYMLMEQNSKCKNIIFVLGLINVILGLFLKFYPTGFLLHHQMRDYQTGNILCNYCLVIFSLFFHKMHSRTYHRDHSVTLQTLYKMQLTHKLKIKLKVIILHKNRVNKYYNF